MIPTVILFLKAPRPGFVKTRLAAEVGAPAATAIYRQLAQEQRRRIPAKWRAEVHFAPADAEPEMRVWLGGRGVFRPQVDGDLGARLSAGFAAAFQAGGAPVIAIGGDCPALDAACLEEARRTLREADVVLGPADDGGYYLIGLNRPTPELFAGIPWSTPQALEATVARAARAGLRVRLLGTKLDIDDAASWKKYLRSTGSDVTVIIPTLNEAARIERTVQTTRAALPGARVIVVDGGSTDATPLLASAAGAELVPSGRGRGIQLGTGAALATSGWLLFLHADTTLPESAARVIADFVARPERQVATFRLRFDQAGWFLRACCWCTRFDSVFTCFGDQGILIRREFYTALGGFPPRPLFEDVALLQRARGQARVWSLPAAVTTSARRFEARGPLRQQWLNARLLFRYLAGTRPEILAQIYRSSARPTGEAPAPSRSTLHEAERPKR